MLVVDAITAQDEHGDVDDGEDAQQQQRGRAAERRNLADEGDQGEGQERREPDRDIRRDRRVGCTLPSTFGRTCSRLMP